MSLSNIPLVKPKRVLSDLTVLQFELNLRIVEVLESWAAENGAKIPPRSQKLTDLLAKVVE